MYLYRICRNVAIFVFGTFSATLVFAGSLTQPGSSTGTPAGITPIAGFYTSSALNYGVRTNDAGDVTVAAPLALNISTSWNLFDGRVQFQATAPYVDSRDSSTHRSGQRNRYLGTWLGWNLGNDFHLNAGVGVIPSMNTAVGANYASYRQNLALTYWPSNQWQVTGHLAVGTGKKGSKSLGSQVGPSWANFDFTALKNIANYQLGVVAFASSDLNQPYESYSRQRQLAIGAVAGYKVGFTNFQLKLSRDVYQSNYRGNDTRLWFTASFLLQDFVPAYKVRADY